MRVLRRTVRQNIIFTWRHMEYAVHTPILSLCRPSRQRRPLPRRRSQNNAAAMNVTKITPSQTRRKWMPILGRKFHISFNYVLKAHSHNYDGSCSKGPEFQSKRSWDITRAVKTFCQWMPPVEWIVKWLSELCTQQVSDLRMSLQFLGLLHFLFLTSVVNHLILFLNVD